MQLKNPTIELTSSEKEYLRRVIALIPNDKLEDLARLIKCTEHDWNIDITIKCIVSQRASEMALEALSNPKSK